MTAGQYSATVAGTQVPFVSFIRQLYMASILTLFNGSLEIHLPQGKPPAIGGVTPRVYA